MTIVKNSCRWREMFLVFGIFLLLAVPCLSQMGDHLREEFHNAEEYGIHIIDSVSSLRATIHDENVRVLCFQSYGEELGEEVQAEILDWVRAGHSLWFYDARLAPLFGMKPVVFSGEEFRSKPEEGVLGGKKRKGVATVGMSLGTHAVQTGVGQVTLFLPEIPQEETETSVFGGIEVEGDTVALLQYELDSPALLACRREGRGFIVFKTLLWNEPLSGDRFQMNLLEYSAGFQVPGPAGVGKVGNPPGPEAEFVTGEPAVALSEATAAEFPKVVRDSQPENGVKSAAAKNPATTKTNSSSATGAWTLELHDGTMVVGEFEEKIVEFETGSSSLKLAPEDVKLLEFGSSVKLDKIVTANGKEQSGLLLSTPIRIRTERGVEEFEKEDLVKLFRSEE